MALSATADSAIAGETPTPDAVVTPTAAPTRGAGQGPHASTRQRRIGRAWWHEARLVAELGLTEDQQKKMDAILLRRMEARRQFLAELQRADAAFQKALAEGDWAAARSHVRAVREHAAAEAESRANIRLEVFQLLTPKQRHELVEKHSNVVTQPWLPGFGRRRSMATGAGSPHEAQDQE